LEKNLLEEPSFQPVGKHSERASKQAEDEIRSVNTIMSSRDRLLSHDQMSEKLYDAESMMHIKSSVANGFVVLLSNGETKTEQNKKKKKSKKKKKNDNSLAFMALTSGNVLDACFGVSTANRTGDTPAKRNAQAAKELLDTCATTDKFRDIAVEAYHDAFLVVVDHDQQMNKLNCFTRCFRAGKIRNETEEKLKTAFSKLVKAVGEKK